MSFLKKVKRAARHYMSMKAVRKKFGLTGGSRHMRQLKRSLGHGKSLLASPVATSATTEGYHYTPRTLSQLTGGV